MRPFAANVVTDFVNQSTPCAVRQRRLPMLEREHGLGSVPAVLVVIAREGHAIRVGAFSAHQRMSATIARRIAGFS